MDELTTRVDNLEMVVRRHRHGGTDQTPKLARATTLGVTSGFTAGAGTAVKDDSTFTGNLGTTAYRISDVVYALKSMGILAP